jgi:hypothetical protein
MNELKNRGVQDVLIAVVDGLKGFPEAITAAFPDTTVQTCVVHLVRHSLNFCAWKDRKAVAADLRLIYGAPTADMAEAELDAFEEKWAGKYASIAPAWRRAWQEMIPFFAFDPAIRKIIYTTNAIESLNRIRRENTAPHCFLTLLIPQINQDPRLVPDREGRDEADLSRDPQLRERRQKCPGMVCSSEPVRYHAWRAARLVIVSETRMGQPRYTEFMALPLRGLKKRGLTVPPELATGDGALGFWTALRDVFPGTREQRCWGERRPGIGPADQFSLERAEPRTTRPPT